MKCKYCGAEIADDSVYCEHCGQFTNPFNKKGVTCSMSLVRWLLMGSMTVLCVAYTLDGATLFDPFGAMWVVRPVLALIIFLICLVLTLKKKMPIPFMVAVLLLFSSLTTECVVGWTESHYYILDFFGFWNMDDGVNLIFSIIDAGIILLYVIYAIIAAFIARKKTRQY